MKELTLKANLENLAPVQEFVEEELSAKGCTMKIIMPISIAVEEVFVNIAHYAYGEGEGDATVNIEFLDDPSRVRISFIDGGVPFNPLMKKDADITLGAEERDIGGLGILMVKKSMDEVDYRYEDKKNVFTMTKNL